MEQVVGRWCELGLVVGIGFVGEEVKEVGFGKAAQEVWAE